MKTIILNHTLQLSVWHQQLCICTPDLIVWSQNECFSLSSKISESSSSGNYKKAILWVVTEPESPERKLCHESNCSYKHYEMTLNRKLNFSPPQTYTCVHLQKVSHTRDTVVQLQRVQEMLLAMVSFITFSLKNASYACPTILCTRNKHSLKITPLSVPVSGVSLLCSFW